MLPKMLVPKRRGYGAQASPWVWSGRFQLHDVDGTLRASVGGVEDIESDLWFTASAAGVEDVVFRILPAGRGPKPVPAIWGSLQHGDARVTCRLRRGRTWGLSYLLGMVLRAGALVTVEAYDKRDEESSAEASDGAAREAHSALASHLLHLPANHVFSLRDLRPESAVSRRFLMEAARDFVGRGVLQTLVHGRRRVFILRKASAEAAREPGAQA